MNNNGGMSEIVLVRHGQTEWSATGRHTSYTDLPLTLEGERQARAVGQALAGCSRWTPPRCPRWGTSTNGRSSGAGTRPSHDPGWAALVGGGQHHGGTGGHVGRGTDLLEQPFQVTRALHAHQQQVEVLPR